MKDFAGKIAVITGGGTGMGRALARRLSREGCHVATCDISLENMEETRALCESESPAGTRFTHFGADVSQEEQVLAFRDHVTHTFQTNHIHLLFNNAGVGAGGSFLENDRREWDLTFAVCWGGVYFTTRAFVGLLTASPEGHLINTSSVNGFWASLGPEMAHTAYSTAKFAVKGFSEALINDFRLHAPHVKVSLVMPGHVGTSILTNSSRFFGNDPKEMTDEDLEAVRQRLLKAKIPLDGVSNEEIRQEMLARAESFRNDAPLTAEAAAEIILEGVRTQKWRILVGSDAENLDRLVREDPEGAYEPDFFARVASRAGLSFDPM